MSGVRVDLSGAGATAALTNPAGAFTFRGLSAATWALEVSHTEATEPALTASDAVQVLEIAAGAAVDGEAMRIAADVSGNGAVTAYDAVLILRRVVDPDDPATTFPVEDACSGVDWFFIPDPMRAVSGQLPLPPEIDVDSCSAGMIVFDPLTSPALDQNFVAGIFGDVDGDWSPALLVSEELDGAVARDAAAATAVRIGKPLRRGRHVRVPVYLDADAGARAIDVTVAIPEGMRPTTVRKARNAFGALVAAGRETRGELRISLASREPIAPGLVLTVGFVMDEPERVVPRVRAARIRVE